MGDELGTIPADPEDAEVSIVVDLEPQGDVEDDIEPVAAEDDSEPEDDEDEEEEEES